MPGTPLRFILPRVLASIAGGLGRPRPLNRALVWTTSSSLLQPSALSLPGGGDNRQ